MSERKQAELELRKAIEEVKAEKAKSEAIIAALGDGISIQDRNYKILYQNQAHKDLIGDHIGEYCYQAYESRDEVCEGCPVAASFKDGKIHSMERSVSLKKGTMHVEITSSPLRDSKGKIVAGIELVRNITERKQSEEALRKSEEQFRNFFESNPLGVCIVDSAGKILHCNDAMVKIFGYTRKELLTKRLIDLTHPEDMAESIKHLKEFAEGKRDYIQFEKRYLKKDGSIIWTTLTVISQSEINGKLRFNITMLEDITERKQAETALRESLERFKTLAEQSPNMIFINQQGKIVYANKKCEDIMGYTKEEFLSPSFDFHSLIASESQGLIQEFFRKHLQGEEVPSYESSLISREGKKIEGIITSKLINYLGEHAILGIITDITERRHVEETLREKESRLSLIFNNTSDLQCLVEISAGIPKRAVAVNRAYLETCRKHNILLTEKDILGQDWATFLAATFGNNKEAIEAEKQRYIEVIRTGQPIRYEICLKTPFGKLNAEVVLVPVFNDAGECCYVLWSARDISERKYAEELLASSEQSYKGLFNSLGDAVYVQDSDGKFLDVNDAAVKMYGYPSEYFIGKTPEFLSAPGKNDLTATMEAIHRAFAGEPQHFEWWGIRKNSEIFPKDVRLTKGSYFGKDVIIAIARDITERKRVEEALRESEERLRITLEETQIGTFDWDLKNDVFYVSPTYYTMLGYEPKKGPADRGDWLNRAHPDDKDLVAKKVRNVLNGIESKYQYEVRIKHADGSYRWISVIGRTIEKDENNKPTRMIGVRIDITDRKRSEEKLRLSEERYRSLFDKMMDGVYRSTHEGKFVDVNLAMVKMFGFSSKEEMLNVDIKKELYFAPSDRDSLFLDTGQEKVEVFRMRRKDGTEIWVEDHGHYVHDEHGNVIFHEGILRNVTERLRTEVLQNAIYQISQEADKAFTLDDLYKAIHQIISTVMPAKNFYIALYDEEQELLSFPYFVDEVDTPSPPVKLGKGLTEYILRTGKPLLCDEATDLKLRHQGEVELVGAPSSIWLGVPLIVSNKTIGIMVVQHYSDPHAYNEQDLHMLEYVSSQVAKVIEQKRSEEALKTSEAKYRIVADNTYDWEFWRNPQGEFLYNSPSCKRITGKEASEFKADAGLFLRIVHPDDQALMRQHRREAPHEMKMNEIEFRIIHTDGTVRWINHICIPIFDKSGIFLGIRGSNRDITERKLAEEKLRESEEQFRLISENVADLIAVIDLNGKRLYSSPSYKNILGDPVSLRGTDSFQEIHPEDRERIKQIFQETVQTGVGKQAEYRFLLKDGKVRYIESQGSVIKNKDGKISQVLVVSRDVTEKKRLEQQFLRSQRMESIGTLAGGIAHDLNNVLAPIMMAIEILRKQIPDQHSQRMLDTLDASAHRGADIVKQVLAFARGIEGERLLLQPKHVIEEVVAIAKETFPKLIEIRTEIPKNLWTISADPTQMHQVILNMCVNARDAMPDGGRLAISAENNFIDENYSKMHTEAKAGPYVIISITDTGTGIPPKILDKIFEPFFTTKEISKGTGLGLSTVHAIVKSHGGFINVYSEMGKGTKFNIYLPANLQDQVILKEAQDRKLPEGNGELILVIDDEASIRDITKATLETNGYNVMTANDGADGIAKYAQYHNDIKVIITDILMPIMDGTATIRALRQMNPEVIIIAASGITTDRNVAQTLGTGVQAFLTKPYTAEKLLTTLQKVLHE